jgi:hypothetical protein
MSLLSKVDLIDSFGGVCEHQDDKWTWTLSLNLLPLAEYREVPVEGESYNIVWRKDGIQLPAHANKTRLDIDDGWQALGTYTVDVRFGTDEVRKDPEGLLISSAHYTIKDSCPKS